MVQFAHVHRSEPVCRGFSVSAQHVPKRESITGGLRLALLVVAAVLAEACSPDLLQHAGIRGLDTAILPHAEAPAFETHDDAPYNSDRSILIESCASKLLALVQNHQTGRETLLIFPPPLVRGERCEDKQSRWPAGLLPAIIGSIAAGVRFAVLRERYSSKTVRWPHELSGLQISQSLLGALK